MSPKSPSCSPLTLPPPSVIQPAAAPPISALTREHSPDLASIPDLEPLAYDARNFKAGALALMNSFVDTGSSAPQSGPGFGEQVGEGLVSTGKQYSDLERKYCAALEERNKAIIERKSARTRAYGAEAEVERLRKSANGAGEQMKKKMEAATARAEKAEAEAAKHSDQTVLMTLKESIRSLRARAERAEAEAEGLKKEASTAGEEERKKTQAATIRAQKAEAEAEEAKKVSREWQEWFDQKPPPLRRGPIEG